MSELAELADRIKRMHEDIRAEVIVSDLLAGGVHIDDLFMRFIGQLKRPRCQDISDVQVVRDEGNREQLKITLNRDSIYDTLPEGLFHQPNTDESAVSVSAMVDEYKQQQQEEAEARLFFAPFENELFVQRTFIESEEFRQLFRIQQSHLESEVLKQFGIDAELPREFTSKLVRILPYISQITGDLLQTEQIFGLLLNDSVSIKVEGSSKLVSSSTNSKLGDSNLGVNLIAGDTLFQVIMSFKSQ